MNNKRSELHKKTVEKYARLISLWIKSNELVVTHENIRRYFALYFPASDVSEKSINEIFDEINKE